jgi:cobalt/nickel transport system permease protein
VDFYRKAGGIGSLETLALGDSPAHRLHPGAKILTTLVYIGTVVSFPARDLSGLGIFFLYPAILMSLSGTPWKPLLARFLVSLPFVLMGAISNLIMLKEPVFYLGPLLITAGMVSCLSILCRAFLAVLAALILIATTPFPDFIRQLGRMGAPRIFCLQTTMTWRYMTVLLSEAGAMYTAYMLRSGGQRGIKMKNMGSFLGALLVRSFDRAERVYCAMKCRGFDGSYTSGPVRALRPVDWLFAAATCGAMILFRIFNAGSFLGGIIASLGGG